MKVKTRAVGDIFKDCATAHRAALIGFLVGGFPTLAQTPRLIEAACDGGADMIELGFPYSDPLADGPTIQAASQRALESGATFERLLETAAALNVSAPLLAFTYFNPIFTRGIRRAVADLAAAGFAGIVIPDLPLEETAELREAITVRDLSLVLLVAPTTALERARRIAAQCSDFVYVVSRMGVTGRSHHDIATLEGRTAQLRTVTDKPLAVGFGISEPSQAAQVAAVADGVIVGSALVEAAGQPDARDAVHGLCVELRAGCTRS